MKKFIAILIILVAFSLARENRADAQGIIYTFSGVGSGTLGVNSFTDVSFVVTLFADTSDIVTSSLLFGDSYVPDSSATVLVNGLGTATVTSQMRVSDFQNLGMVGPATISLYNNSNPSSASIFDVHPDSKNDVLSQPIGPIGGTIFSQQSSVAPFGTSNGDISFRLAFIRNVSINAAICS